MSIFGFLLLVALFFLLRPLIRVAWTVWRTMRQMKNMQNAASSRTRTRRNSSSSSPQPRKKVFRRDEGEYVEFEEITVEESTAPGNKTAASGPSTRHEPRVTDAEWEDIP